MKLTKKFISFILASIIAAGAVSAVYAEDERAKGVVFTAESGIKANTYTGYLSGIESGMKAGDLLAALANKNGIEVKRGDVAVADTDAVVSGDKVILTDESGTVKSEFSVIIMGNADGNDKINLSDASTMLKSIAGWDVAVDAVAADVDGNGAVNLSDVSTLLKAVAGWDVTLAEPTLPGKGLTSITKVISTYAEGQAYMPNVNLRKGQDLAIKFTVEEGMYAKSAKAKYPSWGDNKGDIRLSLYKWDTDYETTVASMPIVTQFYHNFADGEEIVFSFCDSAGKGVGEGEYLWRLHEGYDERINPDDPNEGVGVGLWVQKCPSADSGLTVFYEGVAFDPSETETFGPEAFIQMGR